MCDGLKCLKYVYYCTRAKLVVLCDKYQQFVAYCNSNPKLKKCSVGKVITVSRQENLIIVHRYRPLADGRLRVRWLPAFTVGGYEVLGEGDVAAKENVKAGQIVSIIELNDGVVSHAASRKLDNAGWRYDETELALDDLTREYVHEAGRVDSRDERYADRTDMQFQYFRLAEMA